MWTKCEAKGNSLALERVAVAKGVALYHNDVVQEESGTVILTTTHIHYNTATIHRRAPISTIKQVVLRPPTLTRSAKLVLLMECDLWRCEVCGEVGVKGERCEQCGSAMWWVCDVCEFERNPVTVEACVECGSVASGDDCQPHSTKTDIYMLSFRRDPPHQMHQILHSIITRHTTTVPNQTAMGIGGLLEQRKHRVLEREHAIASLSVQVTTEALCILCGLAEEVGSRIDEPYSSVHILLPGGGLKWANQHDMMTVLDVFINERLLTGEQMIIFTDLYCSINRHCAVGYFVTLDGLYKLVGVLAQRGRLGVVKSAEVLFLCSRQFDPTAMVCDCVVDGGVDVNMVCGCTKLPRPAVQVVLDGACSSGRLVVDEPPNHPKRYHKNAFLM